MGPWTCDSCGQEISTVEDGWVEWIHLPDGEPTRARGLRLVHAALVSPRGAGGCQYDQTAERRRDGGGLSDLPLSEFVGENGLVRLLDFLADGDFPVPVVIEMIQRLHISGYEEARQYLDEAVAVGHVRPRLADGLFHPSQIRTVLEHARAGHYEA